MQHRFFAKLYREPTVAGHFEVATPPGANDQATGKVLVLGTSAGGLGIDQLSSLRQITGHACYWFTNTAQAKAILRSGTALRLVEKAFTPSPNLPGAQQVGYCRISDCTQSSLILEDSGANDVLLLTHRDAGSWGNQIRVKVEAGTTAGKKVSVQYADDDAQIGDNLSRPMLAIICTDSGADAATVTITPIVAGGAAGTLITTVTGAGKSAADLSVNLSDYTTIQQLSDYVNLQPHYTAVVLDGHGSDPSTWLDKVTAQSILLATTMDDVAAAGATVVPVTSTTGMTVGDYVYLEDDNTPAYNEIVRIGSISDGVSFTLDANYSPSGLLYSYTSGAKVLADGTPLNGDLYAVYRWINDNVDEVSATRETASSEGMAAPANIDWTYLTGGGDGTASISKLSTALTAIEDEEINMILVESENAAWHALVKAHCMSAALYNPRIAVVGGASGEAVAARKTRCFNLNSDRAVCVVEGHWDYTTDGTGNTELLSPMYSAALVAGLMGGLEVQDPPTRKTVNVLGLENSYTQAEREEFINAGGLCFRLIPGMGFVVVQGITSIQSNLNLWDRASNQSPEISLARVRDQFMHQFKIDADRLVPGANPRRLNKGDVETLVLSHLNAAVRRGWFASVAPTTDNPTGLPAYDAPVIYKDADAWYVELSVRFNNPNNFLFFTMKVVG